MKKTAFGLALALGVFATCTAFADNTTPNANTYVEKNDGSNQNVTFTDDPMTAGGIDPRGVVLTVRPSAVRMMLLRPRTQFITQMLKSVENL
jgi:hypothetical protein